MAKIPREVKWVLRDGTPCTEEITDPKKLLNDVEIVLEGKIDHNAIENVHFRDPESFRAGEVHEKSHIEWWKIVSKGYKDEKKVIKWITQRVDIQDFICPFEGEFLGASYNHRIPPQKAFENNPSCGKHVEFITKTLEQQKLTGVVTLLGPVGKVKSPRIILPLTVEPSKPRLCIDARFVNLWMEDRETTFVELNDVGSFVYKGSFMTKIDDKSAFHHILLTKKSRTYFGFKWKSMYYVCNTLPFGWKNSSYVYQTLGLATTNFFREKGIACMLYSDDRLCGEIFTNKGYWSRAVGQRDKDYSEHSARSALWLVYKVLIQLGYFFSLKKCSFKPVQRIQYLGMEIDSEEQAFFFPKEKREKFEKLRKELLLDNSSKPDLKALEKLHGKIIDFSNFAFPGAAKYFIKEMERAKDVRKAVSKEVLEEIEFWKFLDTWDRPIRWRSEKSFLITIDVGVSHWYYTINQGEKNQMSWSPELEKGNIKYIKALALALQYSTKDIRDCRVEVQVEKKAVIDIWTGRGERCKDISKFAKRVFDIVIERNLALKLSHVTSNSGQEISVALSSSKLSPQCWERIEREFGCHNLDLMAIDSNVQQDSGGQPLRHFTPFPTQGSAGINVFNQDLSMCNGTEVNAYIFPLFYLIPALLQFLQSQKAVTTIVVPRQSPLPRWWPMLNGMSSRKIKLAGRGSKNAILGFTKHDNGLVKKRIEWELWAFRIERF